MDDKMKRILNRHNPEAGLKKEQPIDPKMQKIFARPANFCVLCTEEMVEHPDPTINKYQKKWSVHWECKEAAENQLDRKSQILSERGNNQ